jgi:hypothetical protein
MRTVRSALTVVGLATLTMLASGCFISSDDDDDDGVLISTQGTLTVDWTVNATKDPSACRAVLADRIEVTILAESRTVVLATYSQSCEAFATSITLAAGSYAADALLVDVAGNPRTTAVQLAPFQILGNDRLPIDFPASSFF